MTHDSSGGLGNNMFRLEKPASRLVLARQKLKQFEAVEGFVATKNGLRCNTKDLTDLWMPAKAEMRTA